ncbi:MAG: AAA family ATPase, partial [Candidatus Pacearchaeota archaeon]|nr:AAA family ATPase [Candidatus Pacearchaeota archaeon]
MVYIKKLVMKGFKSFASETQVPFVNGMNVVVGPNGSGKSNITDAICFVLGRLSIKSLRADKATNLIFAGTKIHKPASQASVELTFDNSDKKFSIDSKEISIERIVRSNGQGIYKINGETKTRQEVLELLAQAGIDPYGFNIILQGEISDLVKMTAEERRKIIEEVAGISIYELRKEKSLRELEKTEEKLKEVSSILRERTSYLKNLEEERKQALKFKKLQEDEKKHKASIIKRKIDEKAKEISQHQERFDKKDKEKQEQNKKAEKIEQEISSLQQEIEKISSFIQKSSGIEQTSLNNKISDIRAEIAVLEVREENIQAKTQDAESRKQKAELEITTIKLELDKLRKDFPSQAKKSQELEKKKLELESIEKQRKNLLNLKEKANSIKEILADKLRQKEKADNESNFILKEISRIAEQLSFSSIEGCKKELSSLDSQIKQNSQDIEQKELKLRQQ